ncbi:MAG: hypothetical protein IIA17_09865 [candidate division Zixibacteria bacterium]|nr:hypothetical protein [candidate division Zixibacteria bacterium]
MFFTVIFCQLTIMGESGVDSKITDPVMEYYVNRSKTVLESGDPLKRGISFSYEAVSVYEKIGRKGRVEFSDSSRAVYYFSFGKLDSLVSDSNYSEIRQPTFDYPNIFAGDYNFNFYPNDTGGEYLAIGFEPDSVKNNEPVGIAIINRSNQFLTWLYLHYPLVSNQKKLSRTYRFNNVDGFRFCGSIKEVGAIYSVFSLDYYSLETRISNIQIQK